MGFQSSYFIAGNYFCIMWESWIGKKKKNLSIRRREKEDTKKGWQNRKKHNLWIRLWMRRMSVYPIRSLIVVFDFLAVITRKVLFFFFYVKVKTNIQTMFPGVTSSPSQLLLLHLSSFLIGAGLYKHCLKHRLLDFKQTHASHLHLPADVTELPLADVILPLFFNLLQLSRFKKKNKKKRQSWERGRGLRCGGPEGQSTTPFYEAQKGNVVFGEMPLCFDPQGRRT